MRDLDKQALLIARRMADKKCVYLPPCNAAQEREGLLSSLHAKLVSRNCAIQRDFE